MDKAMKDALIERAARAIDHLVSADTAQVVATKIFEAIPVFDLVGALERKRRMVIQDFDEQQKADEAVTAALNRMKEQHND